ncbi:MAG: radical SAM protein [Candidatus Omnitrophica bacterium]|nr:radical SAM protein [Candidatus Omnitrophota bacterium]
MKYIYGPVKSRRLGLSLGISLTPYKICNLDCLYCQLGRTIKLTSFRKEYVKIKEIISELKNWFNENPHAAIDFVTISGSGEPTLNSKIGQLITEIRKITDSRIAVITNAVLLNNPSVRKAVAKADLIVPSLDAVTKDVFSKINRPDKTVKVERIIKGLIALRKEFKGKIWLEVMLIRGINDSIGDIEKLKEVVEKINPDKIQLNSPVRSTAEKGVFPVNKNKLSQFERILGPKCQII